MAVLEASKFDQIYSPIKTSHARPLYLYALTFANLRKAFTELRFQTTHTAYLEGRYRASPKHSRLCICGSGDIEDVVHYVLFCHLYNQPRQRFLSHILVSLQSEAPLQTVCHLLADTDPHISYKTSLYARAAKFIRLNVSQNLQSQQVLVGQEQGTHTVDFNINGKEIV